MCTMGWKTEFFSISPQEEDFNNFPYVMAVQNFPVCLMSEEVVDSFLLDL